MCLVRVRNLEVCPDVYASQTLCGTSVYASQLYQISALQDLRQRKWWGMSTSLKEGEIRQAITWSCGQSIQHLSQWHWLCLAWILEHIKIFFQDYLFKKWIQWGLSSASLNLWKRLVTPETLGMSGEVVDFGRPEATWEASQSGFPGDLKDLLLGVIECDLIICGSGGKGKPERTSDLALHGN